MRHHRNRHRQTIVGPWTRQEITLLALQLHDGSDDEPARVQAARAGAPGAQEWIVQRWTTPVYRFCRRMLADEHEAWDAAQDTMVKVLRNIERFDDSRSFSTWVFSIARNTCIDEHRRRRRRAWDEPGDVVDARPNALQNVVVAQQADRLEEALAELPPMYREILVLYHFEHKKYSDIAELLDLPMGTVMNRIFRARKKLRDAYEALGGDPE